MAHFIKETLLVDTIENKDSMIEFGLECGESFYIANDLEDAGAIYLSFKFNDWVIIRDFIDKKFKENNLPF